MARTTDYTHAVEVTWDFFNDVGFILTTPKTPCKLHMYRGGGVGCEAPHRRSILRIFRIDFVPS